MILDVRIEFMSNVIQELKSIVFSSENKMMMDIVAAVVITLISLILITM